MSQADLSDAAIEDFKRAIVERILAGLQIAQICSANLTTATGRRRDFYEEQLRKVSAKLLNDIKEWPHD